LILEELDVFHWYEDEYPLTLAFHLNVENLHNRVLSQN
jgi:hypothetical protein